MIYLSQEMQSGHKMRILTQFVNDDERAGVQSLTEIATLETAPPRAPQRNHRSEDC